MNFKPLFDIWHVEVGIIYFTYEGLEYSLICSEMEVIEFAKVDCPCEISEIESFYKYGGKYRAPEGLCEFLFASRESWEQVGDSVDIDI